MQAKGEAPFRVKVGSARLVTPFFYNFFFTVSSFKKEKKIKKQVLGFKKKRK